jgi:hypothetical protein
LRKQLAEAGARKLAEQAKKLAEQAKEEEDIQRLLAQLNG